MTHTSKETLDKIIIVGSHCDLAFATSGLLFILLAWHTLDISPVSYGYYHVFIWHQIFYIYIVVVIYDFSLARAFEFIFYIK